MKEKLKRKTTGARVDGRKKNVIDNSSCVTLIRIDKLGFEKMFWTSLPETLEIKKIPLLFLFFFHFGQ